MFPCTVDIRSQVKLTLSHGDSLFCSPVSIWCCIMFQENWTQPISKPIPMRTSYFLTNFVKALIWNINTNGSHTHALLFPDWLVTTWTKMYLCAAVARDQRFQTRQVNLPFSELVVKNINTTFRRALCRCCCCPYRGHPLWSVRAARIRPRYLGPFDHFQSVRVSNQRLSTPSTFQVAHFGIALSA